MILKAAKFVNRQYGVQAFYRYEKFFKDKKKFKADPLDIKAATIAEYVVCFANSKGGKILLGVEDDSF